MQDDDLLLPLGTRLVHIGPHKTGTTTVQFAFHAARAELSRQGVHYPGPNSQPMFAVYAITGRYPEYVDQAPMRLWTRVLRGLRDANADRAVISSEGFCDADAEGARRVVRDLDPDRVHVLVTLRPLTELLSSQWQQSVQDGRTYRYDDWLRIIFDDPKAPASRHFWHRHRHDRLVERWASAVGHDQLTVVVVDVRRPESILRLFERLVGLREGTLQLQHRTNRSLTRAEIEVVRSLNAALTPTTLDPRVRVGFVRDGVAELLRTRDVGPEEPRITTPDWARERAAEVSREIVAGIAASGVRVIGPLERLAEPPPSAAPVPEAAAFLEPATAAEIAATGPLGIMVMAGLARGAEVPVPAGPDLATVSTTQLRRVLAGRFTNGLLHRVPTVARHVRRARRAVRAVRAAGAAGEPGVGDGP